MSTGSVLRPSLAGQQFEVVVIGGGVNGVAIARECVRAGRRTLLLEQNDFASGTTSRATRIIHGGLRYLQYAEVSLVRESLQERERLLREQPHLVRPIRFILALNDQYKHNALQVRAGLWLYSRLAGHRLNLDLAKTDLREFERRLDRGQKWSLFEYDDAQCEFPERLVAEWLTDAAKAGAALRNYCRVLDVLHQDGKVTGVLYRDRLTDEECSVECKWVVNATGPWVDQMCAQASVPTGGPLIGGVRGSHIVLPRFAESPDTAVYTQASDGRPMFVIPWNDQLLVGTTEVPDRNDPSKVAPSPEEIDYLLQAVNRMFPAARMTNADIHYSYAGIRPLPFVRDAEPAAITRKSLLWDHKHDGLSGMISVIGGKLTTAGSLARYCARAMGFRPEPQASVEVAAGLASGIEGALWHWAETMARRSGLPISSAYQIAAWHGPRAMCVMRRAMTDPLARKPLCPHSDHIVAEAVNALHYEHAVTLGDVLLRRVPVALGACWTPQCSKAAATAIGATMGWDSTEIEWQLETLETERKAFLFKPGGQFARSLEPADRSA